MNTIYIHPRYQVFANYALGGALTGLLVLIALVIGFHFPINMIGFYQCALALGIGSIIGLMIKGLMVGAIEMAMRASVASAQLNAKRAEIVGHRLKIDSKDKIQAHVKEQAMSIILQMQGPQALKKIEDFFDQKMPELTEEAYFKIDRHLNYLTDRAVHGDIQALKRLYQLHRRTPQERTFEIHQLLERIINTPQEVQALKDKVDTLYDYWKFRKESRAYIPEDDEEI